ncbi:hypothetical protein B0H14DRAFT_2561127 [Mycena olivaceomarginata]|nr:hypothetical protein B0H14DRAFT_2561127 [Mycena olivaceomarginata]
MPFVSLLSVLQSSSSVVITLTIRFVFGGPFTGFVAIISPCNPSSTVSELTNQLRQTRATLVIAHYQVLDVARASVREAGNFPTYLTIILGDGDGVQYGHVTVRESDDAQPRKLEPGESRRKIAFLCASSGTTVFQENPNPCPSVTNIATHNRVNEEYASWRNKDTGLATHVWRYCPSIWRLGLGVPRNNIRPPTLGKTNGGDYFPALRLSNIKMLPVDLNEQLINLFPNAHIGQAYADEEVDRLNRVHWWCFHVVDSIQESPTAHCAGTNVPGELHIKSPAAALGYFGDEDATKETFVDGWVRTGDQVTIDENLEVVYVDRLKVRGFQVAPAELEGCILGHSMVADLQREVPLAFVIPTKDVSSTFQTDPHAISQVKASIMEKAKGRAGRRNSQEPKWEAFTPNTS